MPLLKEDDFLEAWQQQKFQWDVSMGCFKDFYIFLRISGFLGEFDRKIYFFLVITDQSQWKQLHIGSAE